MKQEEIRDKTIVYKLNDGLLVEAPKDMSEQDILTRYYICKFLNPNRPKSWLEKN